MIIGHALLVDARRAALLGALLAQHDAAGALDRLGTRVATDLRALAHEAEQVGRASLGLDPVAGELPTALPTPLDPARSIPSAAALASWLGVAAVAELLGLSERRVRQLADSGELGGVKVKGKWRLDPAGVADRKAS